MVSLFYRNFKFLPNVLQALQKFYSSLGAKRLIWDDEVQVFQLGNFLAFDSGDIWTLSHGTNDNMQTCIHYAQHLDNGELAIRDL